MNEEAPAPDLAHLAASLDEVIRTLQDHPDPEVRRNVTYLLDGLDAMHREGLGRMVAEIRAMAGDAFLNRLSQDPAVRLLLMAYDLVAVDRLIQAEDALDPARDHLRAHGIEVELLEVVGGVVYVRLHGLETGTLSEEAVRQVLEAALREGLLGFQELEIGARPWSPPADLVQIQMGTSTKPKGVEFHPVASLDEIERSGLKAVSAGGDLSVLLIAVDGAVHALRNRCGDSPLPLEFSRLDGTVLVCSWHGCRYDVRTGNRIDDPSQPGLEVYPTRVSDGRIFIPVADSTTRPMQGGVT